MAGASLLLLIDDIASMMDDVSLLTKVAAKKTAGVLGDDLALNAQQVSGVHARHELPVVWAVFKGSAVNKTILVPAALAISAFAPWLVTPLLMLGGLYLCYEGVEKLAHAYLHGGKGGKDQDATDGQVQTAVQAQAESEAHGETAALASLSRAADHLTAGPSGLAESGGLGPRENEKIKGAIRTDFILSAEIIAITLGTVAQAAFLTQVTVLVSIAAVMTVSVYGLVAGIVKLDDAGLYLSARRGTGALVGFIRRIGSIIFRTAPYLMRGLSIVGTAAMFLVGGGILTHGVAVAQRLIEDAADDVDDLPAVGEVLGALTPMLINAVVGIVAGVLALLAVLLTKKILGSFRDREEGAAS